MTGHLHSSQRTSRYHSHIRSNLRGMDIHIRCYHNPSIHILHCCRCYHHSNHCSTSTNHHHLGCLMSIRSLRSKHCSHCHNRILRMGIHILCMGCILRSLMITGHLHSSQRTSRYHSHIRSNLRGMGIHIRCYHSPSIRILHCCHCYHHSNHSCTSRIHHHLGCLMSIRSLRSKRCSHHCIRIHCMGIHIRILCVGCIHQHSMILSYNLHSQRTSNFRNHHHSSFHRMGIHIRCYHNPSIHILHCCHYYHHSNRSCTSRIHHHMGCLMSIRSLQSKHCNHCRS